MSAVTAPTDKSTVLARVRANGYALARCAAALQDDEELVLAAVRQNGMALEFASPRLRAKKAVVLAAVAQDGLALHHADFALRGDKEVATAAAKSNFMVYTLFAPALRRDEPYLLHLFKEEVRGQILCGFMPEEIPQRMAEELAVREAAKQSFLSGAI